MTYQKKLLSSSEMYIADNKINDIPNPYSECVYHDKLFTVNILG